MSVRSLEDCCRQAQRRPTKRFDPQDNGGPSLSLMLKLAPPYQEKTDTHLFTVTRLPSSLFCFGVRQFNAALACVFVLFLFWRVTSLLQNFSRRTHDVAIQRRNVIHRRRVEITLIRTLSQLNG